MKKTATLKILLVLLTTQSCTHMLSHRDYLSEMEHDDAGYYRPNEDFPVMAGDTGRVSETRSQRKRRTPASENEIQERKSQSFILDELKQLESRQSESQFELYEKYKNDLGSTSEKIYFLKLPVYERKEYLVSRGLIKTQPRSYFPTEQQYAQRTSLVNLGMSKSEVMNSIGEPLRIEVAGNPSFENERWVYQKNGASKYIYFESGRVEGWE